MIRGYAFLATLVAKKISDPEQQVDCYTTIIERLCDLMLTIEDSTAEALGERGDSDQDAPEESAGDSKKKVTKRKAAKKKTAKKAGDASNDKGADDDKD